MSQGVFAGNQYKRASAIGSQRDMLYSDPEMQFFQSMESVEYIQKQLGWDEVAEDFEFLEVNCPDPAEEVTVDLQ